MTAVVSKNIRNRVGDLTLQVFGTGPYGTLTPTASGGVVSIPSGYRIVFAVGNGEARIAQIQQGVDVPASNNDVIYAVVTGQEITAIEAAASAPAGSQILGTATGTPVDTFTQDALTGGKADLVFDPGAIHGNVAAEISALTQKAAPVGADHLLIEDSAAGNAKKRALVSSLAAAAKAFMHATMNQQTTGLALNDHVEFDAELVNDGSGSIAVSSGGGDQTDGIITLAANKTYDCLASLRIDFTTSSGQVRYKFFDLSAVAEFGAASEFRAITNGSNIADLPMATGIITVGGSPITIELRLIQLVGAISTIQGGVAAGESFVKIVEIG